MAGLSVGKLRDELNWYSTSVSASVRTTAFGVIAAIWAIFTADGLTLTDATTMGISTSMAVKFSFVFASAGLLADILQYISSYWMYSIGIDKHEAFLAKEKDKEFFYNKECLGLFGMFLYKFSFYLFPFKLGLVIFSAVCFLLVAFNVTWLPTK